MKKMFTALAIGLSITAVIAQKIKETDVPVLIKNAFIKMYPGTQSVQWDKKNNLYHANFTNGTHKGSVVFDDNGKWAERESALSVSQLLQKIKDYMQTQYKNEKLLGATKITKTSGELQYKVEIKGSHLFFTTEGEFVKKE